MSIETVHLTPFGDSALFQCCGKTPFEVPSYHRMTTDPALVTCQRPECTDHGVLVFGEWTLMKVHAALRSVGITGQVATDAISAMRNEGILFRERPR